MIEVGIHSIRMSLVTQHRVVILKESERRTLLADLDWSLRGRCHRRAPPGCSGSKTAYPRFVAASGGRVRSKS